MFVHTEVCVTANLYVDKMPGHGPNAYLHCHCRCQSKQSYLNSHPIQDIQLVFWWLWQRGWSDEVHLSLPSCGHSGLRPGTHCDPAVLQLRLGSQWEASLCVPTIEFRENRYWEIEIILQSMHVYCCILYYCVHVANTYCVNISSCIKLIYTQFCKTKCVYIAQPWHRYIYMLLYINILYAVSNVQDHCIYTLPFHQLILHTPSSPCTTRCLHHKRQRGFVVCGVSTWWWGGSSMLDYPS